jgi:hypothetical protein
MSPITEAEPLPKNGRFTSYDLFVPALISTSGEEWTRVTKLTVEQISVTKSNHSSHMMVLVEDER